MDAGALFVGCLGVLAWGTGVRILRNPAWPTVTEATPTEHVSNTRPQQLFRGVVLLVLGVGGLLLFGLATALMLGG